MLLAAGQDGSFWEEPGWDAAVRTGCQARRPYPEELIELPPGSRLQFLPGRHPLGWRGRSGPRPFRRGLALAAQLPSGYTRTLLPAFERQEGIEHLPFFGYTAVVFRDEKVYCAAVQTDCNPHWEPSRYSAPDLPRRIEALRARFPENRVLDQLKTCALEYGCYNAQNVFYRRWEGAVAVSPSCNAQCRGCISLQPEDMPPSPQQRFGFVPTVEEVVEVGLHHLSGPESILSFGQGCEGEPLLQADLIAESIARLRRRTDRGTLHLNTNASRPEGVRKIALAGLDSIRVSLNSAVPERYEAYYQPRRYRFADVVDSIRVAREHGVYLCLNLLSMPGWNDSVEELEALVRLVREHGVDMIQLRNLNIDPDLYGRFVPPPSQGVLGVPLWLERLREECPGLALGNHTPAVGSKGRASSALPQDSSPGRRGDLE